MEAADSDRTLRQYCLIDDAFASLHLYANGASRKDATATFLCCWKLYWESAWHAGAAA